MLERRRLLAALAAVTAVSWPARVFSAAAPTASTPTASGTTTMTSSAPKTAYAPIHGQQLYYEVHGNGKPLVLLHGGVAASEAFGTNLPLLAATHQVIAVHLQGHGHTRDVDRPLRFETLADDVAALIEHLGLKKAAVLGYSLGGGVALQLAIRHPALVERLVVVSQAMKRSAWFPEVLAGFDQMAAHASQIGANIKQSPMGKLYPEVDWARLMARIAEMESHDYDWSTAVAGIKVPTMLIFADADAMRPEHIVEFYKLLGGGQRDAGMDGSQRGPAQLAIVPGASHYNILATDAVGRLALPFLGS
jgi:pimeloyl-ACP methyl ester carboxylesterase